MPRASSIPLFSTPASASSIPLIFEPAADQEPAGLAPPPEPVGESVGFWFVHDSDSETSNEGFDIEKMAEVDLWAQEEPP